MEELKRQIKLLPLIFYGVGTILGAGIYVIISEIAISSGNQFPLAFIIASFVAITAGLSYAELSSRFPKSAGEAIYVGHAFKNKIFSTFIGYAVALTGLVSSATILKACNGYLEHFIPVSGWISISITIVLIGAIAIKGIKESVLVVSIITLIEIIGLLLVIWFGLPYLERLPALVGDWKSAGIDRSILNGAILAFFAYVGFEDMVNSAEEVVDVEKNLPRAIIAAIIISTILYFFVSLICALALPLEEIVKSKAPLVLIVGQNSSLSPQIMAGIGVISILNGALVQIIMVSRMLYGLARMDLAPQVFGKVSAWTHTPIISTLVTLSLVWILALLFPLDSLAKATSLIILIVFISICTSLIKIKLDKKYQKPSFQIPLLIPALGVIISLFFVAYQITR